MYFWNVNNLINDFKDGNVTDKESVKYFILLGLMSTIVDSPVFTMNMEYSVLDTISTIVSVLAYVLGTYYIYRINKKGDNKDFIARYICLSLPIIVRLFVLLGLIGLIQGVLFTENWPGFGNQETEYEPFKTDLEDLTSHMFSELFFIIYMAYAFNKMQIKNA